MRFRYALALWTVGIICSPHGLAAQSFTNYRQFELGSGVAAVSAATSIAASETKVLHQRPAMLQQLDWRPSRWSTGATKPSSDPVEQIGFSFYNDQLFRMVIDYGSEWTEGMTPTDLVEAISTLYGTPLSGTARTPNQAAIRIAMESGSPVARWGDAGHAVVLYRTSSYRGTFRLLVTDLSLADLASKAESEARRLDEQEAPQRELSRQRKARDDEREATGKAREANKGTFRP